jgi:hypothetical protein
MSTTSLDVNICYRDQTRHFILSWAKWTQPIVPSPPYLPEHRPLKYASFKLGIYHLSHVWYTFRPFHSSWFDRFNNFYGTDFRALNGIMICIRETVTLLHQENKATQTNSLLRLYSYHNSLICEQFTGDRNRYSNLPMTSIYSMLTRDTHHTTPVPFT